MIYYKSGNEQWHLINNGQSSEQPPPRHSHSSVVYDNSMYVYGGMTDLQDRADFWRWDFGKLEDCYII